jgi:hypothetical protein
VILSKENEMKCFYHGADLDGHASGALVKIKYPDCELIPIDYHKAFPWERIDTTTYMVDFSLPREDMVKLTTMTHLVWIDHHATAIDAMAGHVVEGIQTVGIGACALTWAFLYPNVAVPWWLRLLAQYDVWENGDVTDWNQRILPFQYAMLSQETDPVRNLPIWQGLMNPVTACADLILEGQAILRYLTQNNKIYAKTAAFETVFEGLRAIAINRAMASSQLFDTVYDPTRHDVMIAFHMHKSGRWKYSFYATNPAINCGVLAKKWGGGGHVGAAGCMTLIIKKGE